MANETLFKIYDTGETVLVGSLAGVVAPHEHDRRYYTKGEINEQNVKIEAGIGDLDDKLVEYINELREEHDADMTSLDKRVTNEVDTLNTRITNEANTLNDTIDNKVGALDNKLTNTETGLLKQQYDTITDKTQEKLDSQYTTITDETDNKLADLMSKTSNASKNRLLSHIIAVNDVSPNEHIVKCHVKSRNLFDDDANGFKPGTGAESIYSNGILTVKYYYVVKYIKLEEGRTYTFSSVSSREEGSNGGGIHIRAYLAENSSHYQDIIPVSQQLNPTVTFTVPKNYPFIRFTFYANTTTSTYSATYSNIMLEEGTVATEYTPYVNFNEINVRRSGANLLPFPYSEKTNPSDLGSEIRFTVNANNSVTIVGTPTEAVQFDLVSDMELPAGTYSFTGNGTNVKAEVSKTDGTQVDYTNTFTLAEGEKVRLYAVAFADEKINYSFFPMLNVGSTLLPYEPYVGEDYIADENGIIEGMKSISPNMTIYTNVANTLIDCEYNRDINDIISSYDNTLNVFKGKSATITLATTNWIGDTSPFYQNITIPSATANSKIDLQPTVQQIVDLQDEEATLVVENDNGILKVWAIGYKPSKDYTLQATITEVVEQ